LQRQHLHQRFENLLSAVSCTICRIKLISSGS